MFALAIYRLYKTLNAFTFDCTMIALEGLKVRTDYLMTYVVVYTVLIRVLLLAFNCVDDGFPDVN